MFGTEQGLPEDSWDGIQISPDGSVWVRSPKSVYSRAPGQTTFSQEKPDIASSGFWGALTLGRDGSIMVPTDKGLAIHTDARWSVVNRERGLHNEMTGERCWRIAKGLCGSVWSAAEWRGGLGRGVWESWKMDQGLPSDIVWNIRRDQERSPLGRYQLGADAHRRLGADEDLDQKGRAGRRQRPLAGRDVRRFHVGGHEARRLGPDRSCFRKDSPRGSKDGLPCDPEDVFVDRHDRLWLPTAAACFSMTSRPSPTA